MVDTALAFYLVLELMPFAYEAAMRTDVEVLRTTGPIPNTG